MRTEIGLVCGIAMLFYVSSPVVAQVISPVSQNRFVQAQAPGSNVTASATDFGIFNTSVQARYADSGGADNASANQNSSLSGTSIVVSASSTGGGANGGSAVGRSSFDVTFNLTLPVSYTLNGSTTWFRDSDYVDPPKIQLLGATGGVIYSAPVGNPYGDSIPFSTSGVLDAGQYTLSALALSSLYHSAYTLLDFTFAVSPIPEPSTSLLSCFGTCVCFMLLRKKSGR